MGIRRGSISTPIIADGLVFNMDAANRACYPRTGATTHNTINAVNSGSFQDDTSFSTNQGGAFNFDGVDDYIEIGSPIPKATTEITINVWFKATGVPSNNDTAGGCLFVGSSNIEHGPFLSYSWSTEKIVFGIKLNVTYNYSAGFTQNVIHNACVTFNRPTLTCFKNGILVDTATQDSNVTYQGTLANRIGEWGYSSYQRNFNGQIYSTQIYNRALSSTEVLHNYNALKSRFGL